MHEKETNKVPPLGYERSRIGQIVDDYFSKKITREQYRQRLREEVRRKMNIGWASENDELTNNETDIATHNPNGLFSRRRHGS